MFNATSLLFRTRSSKQISNYYRSEGFRLLVAHLPPDEIMHATRGKGGYTLLNDVFFLDFLRWCGNSEVYFRACEKFTSIDDQPT